VRFTVSDIEAPLYESLITSFEQGNPDLGIEIVSINEVLELGPLGNPQVPEDAEQRLAAAADVVSFGASRETVAKGLVRDLGPLIEADPGFQSGDFYPDVLQSFQWSGGTWSLPTKLDIRLIYYAKEAFDAAKVSYPQAGWTWDDLRNTAKALVHHQGDADTRWGFICPPTLVYRLMEGQAGALADYTVKPPAPLLDAPAAADALAWYAALVRDDESVPYLNKPGEASPQGMSPEEALIDKGQAAMWIDWAILYKYRNLQSKVGVAPWPVSGANDRSTPAWVSGISMSAGTTQPEAAWRWMVFLSRQVPSAIGQVLPSVPARRSAAEDHGYWAGLDPEPAAALQYALQHGYVAREVVALEEFNQALEQVLDGGRAPAEALAEAQATAQARLQTGVAGEAAVTPAPTFVVAPSNQKPSSDANATTITFVPGLGSLNMEPYRRLADRFHEANPEIVVQVKMLDLTGATGNPTLSSLAKTADCFMWYPSLQDPASLSAILTLDPFLEADASLSTADYYPQLLSQFTAQGQLWGLPADVTPFVIEYNKALFAEAGVAAPTADWTWDDFLAKAVALTKGEAETKQYGYVAEVFESSDLLLMLDRLGATLVQEDGAKTALTLNDPSVIEALGWYASLSTQHAVKPTYVTDLTKLLGAGSAYMEREGLINTGRAAMWTNTGTTSLLFGPREGLELGVAPLPSRADGASRASLLTTSGFFISAETAQREACWRWLVFLSQEIEAVQGLPARRSLAESTAFRQQAGEERATAYLASVKDAANPSALQVVSDHEWLGGGLYWLYQAYGKVVRGEQSPEQALDEAQDLAATYQQCVQAAGRTDRQTWQGCLQETDPSLPAFLFAQ
jgi:multiple sugar transport system substrate-binding protein